MCMSAHWKAKISVLQIFIISTFNTLDAVREDRISLLILEPFHIFSTTRGAQREKKVAGSSNSFHTENIF